MATFNEKACLFSCLDDELIGILHSANPSQKTGVLVLVGGPQYRVGSHRQFVLLSRQMVEAGIPSFRFDFRGMGDSTGERRTFQDIDDDIQAAIDTFLQLEPGLESVVIWGLCDAASAGICYASSDSRVSGVVMVNPWVRTEQGAASAQLKHYYSSRMFSLRFWNTLIGGKVDLVASVKSFFNTVSVSTSTGSNVQTALSLPDKVLAGMTSFKGSVLLVLSGNDLTAREFEDALNTRQGRTNPASCSSVTFKKHDDADHTFSCHEWRSALEKWTIQWIQASVKAGFPLEEGG